MERHNTSLWMGALMGGLLTAPLMAVGYIGHVFAELPFLPFDLFDWVARTLPGGLITFGIDTMVNFLIAIGLGGNLDDAAKLSERLLALSIFLLIGVVAGMVFYAVMNRSAKASQMAGILAGIVFGLPLVLISFAVNFSSSAEPLVIALWFILLFVGWGALLSWTYQVLNSGTRKMKLHSDGTTESSVELINRRQFIVQMGGATATVTVMGAGLGAFLNNILSPSSEVSNGSSAQVALTDGSGNPLPNASDPLTPAPGTRLEYTPLDQHYRIDIVSGELPSFDEATYRLPITGAVNNPVELTLEEIRALPAMTEFITMSCISNRVGGSLISTTKWTGVSAQKILELVQPTENAVALLITGGDGFDEYVALDLIREDERIMFAYAFDDQPLPQRNGYPLRTHIPNRYGMKQPKWINGIEVVETQGEGYWVRRGWSRDALIRSTSVIDTVATEAAFRRGGTVYVPIGGMAWAGARGISHVEVRVDGGEWQPAKLRSPISERTWYLWRYDWAFSEGEHTFEVRCVEGDGTPQIEAREGVRPDGATGYHSIDENVQDVNV